MCKYCHSAVHNCFLFSLCISSYRVHCTMHWTLHWSTFTLQHNTQVAGKQECAQLHCDNNFYNWIWKGKGLSLIKDFVANVKQCNEVSYELSSSARCSGWVPINCTTDQRLYNGRGLMHRAWSMVIDCSNFINFPHSRLPISFQFTWYGRLRYSGIIHTRFWASKPNSLLILLL